MDELPPELLLNILNLLNDSESVARCRVASKTLNSLKREISTVNLICTLSRFFKSRPIAVTPFKTIFKSLINDSVNIRSISVGVDKALKRMSFDDWNEDDLKDLYLTDVEFVKEWLPRVRDDLEMLSISDFWLQSCWRKSDVLALVSSNCSKLVKLEVKNAWLSVVGLTQMPNLRHLTLEFIRLDDENLEKVNECFPFLQVLNLIGVGGLKEPRIRLLNLKSCHWTVSNAPRSMAILAPNLLELELNCSRPRSFLIETPKLVKFHFSVEDAKGVSFGEFRDLNSLELISPDICRLIRNTHFGNKIRMLAVDLVKSIEQSERQKLGLGILLKAFPGVVSLSLSPKTWSDFETHFQSKGPVHMKGANSLKLITARFQSSNHTDVHQTVSFIRSMLNNYRGLTDMRLMIHQDKDPRVRANLISACMMSNPRVRWKWGIWAEGGEDMWLSDSA
ncbi:PREDICTED: F-box/LRR-repeat protein At4g29420-like [Camelina sativa]|uniref:F-box/LRR-repeat protein At4g29420-like n=1 Tax=Camelina sativa TaxID=90675 RepID=A0ABM0UAG9_CAMSA|nr:PREDICTED: F-box/LRR-repeat protein At4g29420-like [Camelina sativa]